MVLAPNLCAMHIKKWLHANGNDQQKKRSVQHKRKKTNKNRECETEERTREKKYIYEKVSNKLLCVRLSPVCAQKKASLVSLTLSLHLV